jgi:UDP-glucose 4-epimerase
VILNAAAKYDKRIVIASTSEIYGKNSKQPLSEIDDRIIGTPQKLRWTYSDAKALEEASAHFLFLTRNLKVTTIRFFNTVGPRQTGKYGMVIPRFIEAAVNNKPINIFGDGSQTRVFCHVSDAVKAVLSLVKNDQTIGEVFNLGGFGEISIKDLAELIIEQTSSKSTLLFTDYDEAYSIGFEEMMRRVPDISKINRFTGWSPKINLRDIIRDVTLSLTKEI